MAFGVLFIFVGGWAIWARRGLTETLKASPLLYRGWFGEPTPRLVVLWGIGVIVVGVIFLLGY